MTPLKDNFWLLPVTGLLPPLLQLWPLPEALMYWRPSFPVMFVAFWAFVSPAWMGTLAAFSYGFVLEQMAGLPIGSYAVSCALVATFIKGNYARFKIYSLPQQASVIAIVLLIAQMISLPLTDFYRLPYHGFGFILTQVFVTSLAWLACVALFFDKAHKLTQKHV